MDHVPCYNNVVENFNITIKCDVKRVNLNLNTSTKWAHLNGMKWNGMDIERFRFGACE